MQQVKFPGLGKCDTGKYFDAIVQIYQRITQEELNDRSLRRFLRSNSWMEKEGYEDLLEFLDVKVDASENVTLGKWARSWHDKSDAIERRKELFNRLAGMNEILVKYVFDAVQERLYSTSELYRMLTSYVYPGERVDLPEFKNWLAWIQATDRIRVLGIRWAPGKLFDASASYIASIDVDEILEEEAEDELVGAEPEPSEDAAPDEPTPASTPSSKPAPAAVSDPDPEPDIGWEPPEDDELDDDPAPAPTAARAAAAAPAVAGDQLAALVAAMGQLGPARSNDLIDARLLKPAPYLAALADGAPLERVREAMAAEPASAPEAWIDELVAPEERQANNVRQLLEWWSGVEDRPALRADQFGIMPYGEDGWQEGKRARFIFRMACLAVAIHRAPADGDVEFAVLDGAGFYGRLFDEPGSVERLLDELFEQGLGGRAELFRHLHLTLMLARSLRGAEAFCEGLPELDADAVISGLWKRLAAFQLDAEVLWVVRELSMFGILRQPELRECRVVPTAAVRRAAFHLGLLETAQASSLPALLFASRRLSPLVGNELEGPLLGLWKAYGAHLPGRFWSR